MRWQVFLQQRSNHILCRVIVHCQKLLKEIPRVLGEYRLDLPDLLVLSTGRVPTLDVSADAEPLVASDVGDAVVAATWTFKSHTKIASW